MVGFPAFVSDSPQPTLDGLIDHVDLIASLVGVHHVGVAFNSFHGQAGVVDQVIVEQMYEKSVAEGLWTADSYPPPSYHYPKGIETPQTLSIPTRRLLEHGYTVHDTKKILNENWLSVFKAVRRA